tara:strand:+ start:1500 stop:1802 length:303 start_codon:yes stop_codon:yes gene_type:complete
MLKGFTVKDLSSKEFAKLRAARIAGTDTKYIVWFELLETGKMVEMDAESEDHARRLIDHFMDDIDYTYNTASFRKVRKDGTLLKCEDIIDRDMDYTDWDL